MPRPKPWRSARLIRAKSSAADQLRFAALKHHLPKLILLVDDEPHRQDAGMRFERRKRRIAGEADVIFFRGDEHEVFRLRARDQCLRLRRGVAMMVGKA